MPQQENPLGRDRVGALLRRFAIPSIIGMLVTALYNIVDQIFIGQSVGMLGNAATNVTFPLSMVCVALALLFGIGGAANFNLSLGAGDRESAQRYVGNAIVLLFSFGAVFCLGVEVFLHPLMYLCGSTAEVMPYAETYTQIVALGFPFLIYANGGSNLVRADGSPRYSMLCMLTGAVINTILDPIFIFGCGWGMAGAAWATVTGQVISALMVTAYLRRFRTVPLTRTSLRPQWKVGLRIASLGAAGCFNQLAMMVVQIVMNNTLRYYGALSVYGSEIPLAVAGIIAKVNMIFFSLVIGLSQGLQPIVSFNYGARQYQRVRETYRLAVTAATLVSVVAFLCFQLFPRPIIRIFGSGNGNEQYFLFASEYFRIFMFFTFLNGIQPITSNFFTSIGKATRGIFLSLTRQIIFLLPLILLLPRWYGIDGLMFAGPIADFTAAALAIILAARQMRKLKGWEKQGVLAT